MFYVIEVKDHIRVSPSLFGLDTEEAIERQLDESYKFHYFNDLGKVISVIDVIEIDEGIVIPGDGAAYYKARFSLLVWKPELQELVYGVISEISNFGAFINLGAFKGMIHISQTMEDYVSFSKSSSLLGKSSGRNLQEGDLCLARIIAISKKERVPKIGLTMRQPGLGKLEWIKETKEKKKEAKNKSEKKERVSKKGKSK